MGNGELASVGRTQGPLPCVGVTEVGEALRYQCVEGLVGEEEGFVGDVGFDGEPEKLVS